MAADGISVVMGWRNAFKTAGIIVCEANVARTSGRPAEPAGTGDHRAAYDNEERVAGHRMVKLRLSRSFMADLRLE